jgi:hypothetical protein
VHREDDTRFNHFLRNEAYVPAISVVAIGRDETSLRRLREECRGQTFDDYEFVSSTVEGIPRAWNEAIADASGELCVFMESDAAVVRDDWLETIAETTDPTEDVGVHFGDVGRGRGLQFANFTLPRRLAVRHELDESFPVCEDTEWFARLESNGVALGIDPIAPVYHAPQPIDRGLARAYQIGVQQARIYERYGSVGPNDVSMSVGSWIESDSTNRALGYVQTQLKHNLTEVLFGIGFLGQRLRR